MYDVVALGEALIDFSPAGKGKMGNPCFEMNPGGGPLNCLAAAGALGAECAFIGMVGQDMFGEFLKDRISGAGISLQGVRQTGKTHTTMAFVHIGRSGEREFSFLRNPGADLMLTSAEVDCGLLEDAGIFHFSSLSLTDEPARGAALYAAEYRKKSGKIISFDPNYRALLWKSREDAVRWMVEGMRYADIVKISDDEMAMIFGIEETAYETGADKIIGLGAKTVLVTCGSKGAFYKTQRESGFRTGYSVNAIDTTGCGDAFIGAFIYSLCRKKEWSMERRVDFANAAGALCATKMGGMPSMPSEAEVDKLINNNMNKVLK